MLTRIAPTPSGYLHQGNIANALAVVELARRVGADVALRIDDIDATRYRREYVDHIFDTLRGLGITWTLGPRSTDEFEAHWSQRARVGAYRTALEPLVESASVYACACSRSRLPGPPTGGCPGRCGDSPQPVVALALRLRVPVGTSVDVMGSPVDVSREMGDFVVWRRDGLPSYHLVSIVDDARMGTTHIVRGEDLVPSTAAQIHLAGLLGLESIIHVHYFHHPLVTGPDGAKLSKSTLRSPGQATSQDATRQDSTRRGDT